MFEVANTMGCIRNLLMQLYPGVDFCLSAAEDTAHNSCISIEWIGGPEKSFVKALTDGFKMGYFDQVEDKYILSNMNWEVPQVGYIKLLWRDYDV